MLDLNDIEWLSENRHSKEVNILNIYQVKWLTKITRVRTENGTEEIKTYNTFWTKN